MTEVVFRPLHATDAPAIQAVALEAWRYTYRDIYNPQFIENFVAGNYSPQAILALLPRIAAGQMFFQLAVRGDQILGFCNIAVSEQNAQLLRIYLLPSQIGQGLGRKLLGLGETFIRNHELPKYFCFVHKDNQIGKRFYLRNGFQHVIEKDHEDEWFMEKQLSK